MSVITDSAYLTPFMIYSTNQKSPPETLEQMVGRGDYISVSFVLLRHEIGLKESQLLPEFNEFWAKLEQQYTNLKPTDSLNNIHVSMLTGEWNDHKTEWYESLQHIFSHMQA